MSLLSQLEFGRVEHSTSTSNPCLVA
jgi:hypothetical protein